MNPESIEHPTAGKPLSTRELHVLRGMADGLGNKDIGDQLGITEDTVKTLCKRIFRKLRAPHRTTAVAIGYRTGLLPIDIPQPPQEEDPPTTQPPAEAEAEAEAAKPACCLHCRACLGVLTDGKGERGIIRRMTDAIRHAKLHQLRLEALAATEADREYK